MPAPTNGRVYINLLEGNVNPGLINPKWLFNCGGTISVAIKVTGGTTTMKKNEG
jgi:hypothetical protein